MEPLENLETSALFLCFPFLFGLIRQKFYLITCDLERKAVKAYVLWKLMGQMSVLDLTRDREGGGCLCSCLFS